MKIRIANVAEATRLSQQISRQVPAADIDTHHAGETVKETTAITIR
jgi:hypothetical protein